MQEKDSQPNWKAPHDLVLTAIHAIRPVRVFLVNPETKQLERLWPSKCPVIPQGAYVTMKFIDGGSGPDPILCMDRLSG